MAEVAAGYPMGTLDYQELVKAMAFVEKHEAFHRLKRPASAMKFATMFEFSYSNGSGIGTNTYVKCCDCNEVEEITNFSAW